MHLVKQVIKAAGKIGVPQGGPFSPLASNIYLNEVDWKFDAIRRKTAEGDFEAVNYHRFADDMLITVSGHSSKRGWAELALQRLREQLEPLGVELNLEKTRMVNALKGDAFPFLGFDLCRVKNRSKTGQRHRKGDQRDTGWVGELFPRGELQWRIQRSARLHGDENPDTADQKETEAKK